MREYNLRGIIHNPKFWWQNYRPRPINYIKFCHQRIVHGWSIPDTWSFDKYLGGVISEGCRHLAANTHSWPGEPMTFEQWQATLIAIAEGFEAANALSNLDYANEDWYKIPMAQRDAGKQFWEQVNSGYPKDIREKILEWEADKKAVMDKGFDLFREYFHAIWD